MEHDFLELDEYVLQAERPADEKPKDALLPIQENELVPGAWAIQLDGMREGENPLTWDVAVFYIYDQQDFIALSAVEGSPVEELSARAQDAIDRGMRFGRRYSSANEMGVLDEVPASQLLPITEEQADQVRYCEYKVGFIITMCDWFEPLLDATLHAAAVHGIDGQKVLVCPECKSESTVRAVVDFTGVGGFVVLETEDGYNLVNADGFRVQGVKHVHLRCVAEGCTYDACVDLNEKNIHLGDY